MKASDESTLLSCRGCARLLPTEAFQLTPYGTRRKKCRTCRNLVSRECNRRRRAGQSDHLVDVVVTVPAAQRARVRKYAARIRAAFQATTSTGAP